MARQAAELTPEVVERRRQIAKACQQRYYLRHYEQILRKKRERYTPEQRRKESLEMASERNGAGNADISVRGVGCPPTTSRPLVFMG